MISTEEYKNNTKNVTIIAATGGSDANRTRVAAYCRVSTDKTDQVINADLSTLRTAAYCRVSTDSSDQLESYNAQVAYYSDAISKNPKWRFAGIYADEGIIYGEQKLEI